MNTQSSKPTIVFWIIAIVGLLWNAFGVLNFIRQTFMLEKVLEDVPVEQHAMYENVPTWLTICFGIAVIGGTLGCVGLLVRKKWATPLFSISLIAIVIQMVYNMSLADYREFSGATFWVFPLIVIAVGAILLWFSRKFQKSGLLS